MSKMLFYYDIFVIATHIVKQTEKLIQTEIIIDFSYAG